MGKNRKSGRPDSAKKILSGKRDELRSRIERQRAQMTGERDPDDDAALAVSSIERELAMANLDRDTRTLAEVEAALRSIESGLYGICARCEERISDARLHALPWTRLCLTCASGGVRLASGSEQVHPQVVSTAQFHAALRGRARAK
jgi:DnaK suppressor protein